MNKKIVFLLAALSVWSCSPNRSDSNPVGPGTDRTALGPSIPESTKCVQVFYDKETPSESENRNFGQVYATMTGNLLSHFKEYEVRLREISDYRAGDLEKCKASIYLGSDYYSYVPEDFIKDYKTTKKNVAWVGYSFWDLDEDLDGIFGVSFDRFTGLSSDMPATDGKPSFYRDVIYKKETFKKFNEWNKDKSKFLAAYELAQLKINQPSKNEVLAWARHSATGEEIPWAIRAGNRFLVTEVPLSYIHESDRYLIFADLLFDILDEKPLHEEKLALIRLEDVHAYSEMPQLMQAVRILWNEGIKPHISIIPIFRDPFGKTLESPLAGEVELSQVLRFMNTLQRIKNGGGATFIWHGVTHQYKNEMNPFTGATGDDFEFWDARANTPIAEDSESYVMNLLGRGRQALARAGIETDIWLTPHYQASPLDNSIFGREFRWNVGRMIYLSEGSVVGQFFPFELYKDAHGQKVIPENLGNVQPDLNDQVTRTRSVEEILEDSRRNLVLRDVWASVFYHPFLLEGQDPTNTDFQKLVVGLKNLGYRFVDLKGSF